MIKTLGRYELRKQIGRGGAGTVFEARDSVLDRRVAIKVVRIRDDDPAIEELLTRFRQEAQVGSRLSHPSVVQVYDYGEVDGEAFIVMEFVDGETLKALLDRGERLPLTRTIEIMQGVLRALDHCHRQQIVHRDIKPANIMLPSGGGVKLADFGIARIENSELTVVGTVMGSPSYMSPEQFTARDPVGVQTDIWSSAVVLYEMLTGTRPFTGSNMALIGQSVVSDPVQPPSRRIQTLPPALDQVLLRALRKAPADRFPSAEAFSQALAASVTDASALAGRPAAAGSTKPLRLAMAGAAAAVLLAAAAGWFWFGNPAAVLPQARPHAAQQQVAGNPGSSAAETGQPLLTPLPDQVAAVPCSTVSISPGAVPGGSTFAGIIGSGAPHQALDAIIGRLAPSTVHVLIQTFPRSDVSCQLADLVRANAGAYPAAGTHLSTFDGRTSLTDGEDIRVRLAMPDFDGEVRLEDFNSDGRVDHLMEANLGSPPRYRAGEVIGLGRNGDDLIGRVSPPYGSDILVAVVSSEPLFKVRRPAEETSARFLDDLQSAIAELRLRGGHAAADALVLKTAPH